MVAAHAQTTLAPFNFRFCKHAHSTQHKAWVMARLAILSRI